MKGIFVREIPRTENLLATYCSSMDDLLAAVPEIYIKEALHADNGKEIVHQHYDHHQAETKGQGQVKLTHKQLYNPI